MTHIMYDTAGKPTNISDTYEQPFAVAGYVDGDYPSYIDLVDAFPHSHILSITTGTGKAAFLDFEKGDTTSIPVAVKWLKDRIAEKAYRPGIYADASNMPSIQAALNAAGLKRADYRLWVADWTGKKHLPEGMDACQYATNITRFDTSVLADDFFPKVAKKKSKAAPVPKVSGAAAGAAIGVGITAILKAVGVHVTAEEAGAISTVTGTLGGYITPQKKKAA